MIPDTTTKPADASLVAVAQTRVPAAELPTTDSPTRGADARGWR